MIPILSPFIIKLIRFNTQPAKITGRYLISTNNPDKVQAILEKRDINFKKLGQCNNKNKIIFNEYNLDKDELVKLYVKSIESEMEQ